MAGNARFHDKHHRTNHHTLSTAGFPDSATDPIASPSQPFQGDFVVNGVLSSSKGLNVLSADYAGDIYCENIYVRDTTYTDFISGTGSETIISDGALTGYGPNTLTLDFGTAIYNKTPIVYFTNSLSAASAIYTNFSRSNSLSSTSISAKNTISDTLSTISLSTDKILSNLISSSSLSSTNIVSNSLSSQKISATDVIVSNNITVSGNCLIYGNLSALGDLTEIETILHSSSAFNITNTDTSLPALTISQEGTGNIVLLKYTSDPNFVKISLFGLSINSGITALSSIYAPNINTVTSTANSVFSNVSSNSANWVSTNSIVFSNSATWVSTYNTVSSNSANWESTYSTVSSNSANWESSYSNVSSNSANWNSTYNTVSSNSANWNSTYSTVSSNSARWESVHNTVSSTSSTWVSTYSTVSSNSAHWMSTYSTVSSNSAQWLSGDSTLSFAASTIHVEKLSAHNLFLSNTLFVSITSVTAAPATTIQLDTNSPSYVFATVSATGTTNFNLPSIASNNKGMFFYIKNTSPLANAIIAIRDSSGTPIAYGSTINGNDAHCTQVVWDGNTWQTIFTF